jgi:mRNA-degrading endonuclease RelE of RelBE toxin-antitoxin system
MPQDQPKVSIELTPEFQQNLRELSKRYRRIRLDVEAVINELQNGNFLGDRVPGMGQRYAVFKLRVRNSDIQKGKSAGYRLLYQVESPTNILLLTIYAKSDQEDISANRIREILREFYGRN